MALSSELHRPVSSETFTIEMEKFENEFWEVKIDAIIQKKLPELTRTFLATATEDIQELARFDMLKVLREELLPTEK